MGEKGGYLIWLQYLLGFIILGCYAENVVDKSITCYECNSVFDPRCGDPLDPYTLGTVNCSLKRQMYHLKEYPPTLCRKITQKVQGHIRVIRGCGFMPEEEGSKSCYKRTGTHDVNVEYCACNENLCNSGKLSRPSITVLSSAILITVIYLFGTS